MTRVRVLGCVAALLSLPSALAAQAELDKLRDGDTDSFGRSVAVAGDVAWIGGLFKALAYHRIDGEWIQVLDFPWNFVGSFGADVATDGETAVVGSTPSGPILLGQAYVFERHGDSWTLAQTLHGAGSTSDDQFGDTAAVSGATLMVGAPFDSTLGNLVGSVHVFERIAGTWTETAQLYPSNPQEVLRFGGALALQGDRVVIGAGGYDDGAHADVGSAYVFDRQGGVWTETAQLVAKTAAFGDSAGGVVALDGGLVLVGCESCYDDAGAVRVFELMGGAWTETAELTAPDGNPGERFGSGVATSLDRLLIGKEHDIGFFGQDVQTAYLFEREGHDWVPTLIQPSDKLISANYGGDVTLDGDVGLIGAPGDEDTVPGGEGGSAYVLDVDATTAWASLGQGLAGAAGVPLLVAQGNLFAGHTLTVALTGAAPLAPVGVVMGLQELGVPFKGGTLVPDPLSIAWAMTGVLGTLVVTPTLPGTLPFELQIVAQAWVVDASGPKGFAASNALKGKAFD